MLQAAQLIAAAELARQEHRNKLQAAKVEKRLIRDRANPFQMPATEFKANYRLPPEFTFDIVTEITDHMRATMRISAVPNELKVLTAINFLATDIDDADLNIPVLEDEEAEDLDDNNFAALGRQARARLVASMQMP
ncbi:hypothetical protein B566_EDAN015698 [Ephemera danica]|nr:hypothetical protein B566_EDAN015698 [Ephemera danica]